MSNSPVNFIPNTVTFINNTNSTIRVRVTGDYESDVSTKFFDVSPGKAETWKRTQIQAAYVLREDTSNTEVLVVKPAGIYTICGN